MPVDPLNPQILVTTFRCSSSRLDLSSSPTTTASLSFDKADQTMQLLNRADWLEVWKEKAGNLMNRVFPALLVSVSWIAPLSAQQQTQRANITGNAVDGKCTIEVSVDGSAEVEVRGDIGRLRNLSGQRAEWRRFVCNGRMPDNPRDFRFRGIDGRGNVQLLQDPRQSGGPIVFRIDDPQGGREGYTVDLEWRGSNDGQWNSEDTRGWQGPDSRRDGNVGDRRDSDDRRGPVGIGDQQRGEANRDRRFYDDRGRWNRDGANQAMRLCQDAAAQRIQGDGFRKIKFRNVTPDDNSGRNDWVTGSAEARQGQRNAAFQFSCSVDLGSGQVRSVEVQRR